MIHLAPERMGLGKSHADVESLTITSTSDRRSAQGNTFQLAGLPVLVRKVQSAPANISTGHVKFIQDGAMPRITHDNDFLPEIASCCRFRSFCNVVKLERPDVVFTVCAPQAFNDKLTSFLRKVQYVFVISLDGLVISNSRFIRFARHFIDDRRQVTQESVIVRLVLVFLVKPHHCLLCTVHFNHRPVNILLGKEIHDLHFVKHKQLKRTRPVRADIVVGDDGSRLIRDRTGVKVVVNLFCLGKIQRAFFIVSVIMLQDA